MTHTIQEPETLPIDPTQIRFLTPDMCQIHLGAHDALHVTVKNERIYGGVYATRIFPVGHPGKFISLIYIGPDGKETEVGIIRELEEFPEKAVQLIQESLQRRYLVRNISKINKVGLKYGFIAFEVVTDKGPSEFFMYWQHDKAHDYGVNGKVLLDVDDNRYMIADIDQLSAREKADFQRFIYW
ncbi:MAG: DUF1854 domain-containing protein [Sedimentisphaerales bacterium]|nr:DUF1854 domain-containing protein [Sedimentisphaerales bacterium]